MHYQNHQNHCSDDQNHHCHLKITYFINWQKIRRYTTNEYCLPACLLGLQNLINTLRLQRNFVKWSLLHASAIILLLCCLTNVLAAHTGNLMTPRSFTALSGDLHLELQYIPDDNCNSSLDENTNMQIPGKQETIIANTLIISKYIEGDEAAIINDWITLATTTTSKSEISREGNGSVAESKLSLHQNVNMSTSTSTDRKVLQSERKQIIQNVPIFMDPRANVTQIDVPCQIFMHGGRYEVQLVAHLFTNNTISALNATHNPILTNERWKQSFIVQWPSAEIIISPGHLRTYPPEPLEVVLRFTKINCDIAWHIQNLPEFWLELLYCGRDNTCLQISPQNNSKSSVLFAEQVRGFPKAITFKLKCELFGLAGNYAVQLRPMLSSRSIPIVRRFLNVDWSEKYVFNVYARSIYPCDPHTGIGVLYEYPECILQQGDKVRIYAKLRADVASLKPPTSLHYIAEQRVTKNKHSMYFSCDLFTEKYVEYCFAYVTQSISGAVADVRMDCVPTLPVQESDTGGWGPWSEWTSCSSKCLGGTRNRYRFCDSPPPRYGGKFCEGPSVQTEFCGNSLVDIFDCIYESASSVASRGVSKIGTMDASISIGINNFNRTEVNQEIGPGCRCGCIVHLGLSKPQRIIAGVTQSCPGRSFWLIQVDNGESIEFTFNFLRLRCDQQYIKLRDGASLSATLLTELQGGSNSLSDFNSSGITGGNISFNNIAIMPLNNNQPLRVFSSGAQLLLEFYTGDANNHVKTSNSHINSDLHNGYLCSGGFLAHIKLLVRNRSANEPIESTASELPSSRNRSAFMKNQLKVVSFTWIHLSATCFSAIMITISLVIGVQYLMKYRKYHLAMSKSKDEVSLLHTPDESHASLYGPPSIALSTATLISEVIYLVRLRPKHYVWRSTLMQRGDVEYFAEKTALTEALLNQSVVNCKKQSGSVHSLVTLRNEIALEDNAASYGSTTSLDGQPREQSLDVEKISYKSANSTKCSRDSASILSSELNSLCISPRFSCNYSEAPTIKFRYPNASDQMKFQQAQPSIYFSNASTPSQLKPKGVYLSSGICRSLNIISTATIHSTITNPKECKDNQNRKRLIANSGSEFSFGNSEDFEMDYYDYNVTNTESVPGSYLGMDPAYLIWMPPFNNYYADSTCDKEEKNTKELLHHNQLLGASFDNETIKIPQHNHLLSVLNTSKTIADLNSDSKELTTIDDHRCLHARLMAANNMKNNMNPAISVPNVAEESLKEYPGKHLIRTNKVHIQSVNKNSNRTSLPFRDISLMNLKKCSSLLDLELRNITNEHKSINNVYIEKETNVLKSSSDLRKYSQLMDGL